MQAEQADLFENVRAGTQSVEPAAALMQSSLTSTCCREKGEFPWREERDAQSRRWSLC